MKTFENILFIIWFTLEFELKEKKEYDNINIF